MLQATSVKIEEEKYCEIMCYFFYRYGKNKIKIIFFNISGKICDYITFTIELMS